MTKAKFHKDMDIDVYHSHKDVISKSMLSDFADCPARFKHKYIDGAKEEKTRSLRLGNAVHVMALEPELWKKNHHVTPDHYYNDKGQKQAWRNDARMQVVQDEYIAAGYDVVKEAGKPVTFKPRESAKIVLSRTEHELVQEMANSLARNSYAVSLLKAPGYVEGSIFFDIEAENEETGEVETIKARTRPDLMRNDGLLADVKIARSVKPSIFFSDACNFHYELSPAMSFAGYEALHGKPADNYAFVAVEQTAPFLVECFESLKPIDELLGMSYLEFGQARLRKLLSRYVACRKNNNWPSYQEKIGSMGVPGWVAREFIEKGI